jgi:vacuolar-type H+-ATPase subunit H
MKGVRDMQELQAKEWLNRAEETYAAAETEHTEAKRGKAKKEAKEVLAWAKGQMEQAAEAVLLCQIDLGEIIEGHDMTGNEVLDVVPEASTNAEE